MICAYRLGRDMDGARTVALHIDSFDYYPVPPGYTVCDWPTLQRAWRLKDRLAWQRIRREQVAKGVRSL